MPLNPIVVRAPGFKGLDLEGEDVVADATYAKVASNLVFDKAGRLSARKGYAQINDTTGSAAVDSIFMYDYSGGDLIISATGNKIYEESTDRTGAITTPTADHWQFQNFNGKVVGAQNGHDMIVKTGAGNFADIGAASGTVPNGNVVHSAFGRLWATNTAGEIIYGSALLDETHWTTGAIEIKALGGEMAVRDGYDRITAINNLQGRLVVFLENSILIYANPWDSSALVIEKAISGIGCIARDSVQPVGNDLVFLSRDGLRSLVRAIADDNFPLRDISKAVRGEMLEDLSGSPEDIKSAYYPDEGIYIMLTTGGTAWVFDHKSIFEDGLPRVTTWDVPNWHSLYYHEGVLYIGQLGEYGQYSGYQEDGAAYDIEYKSLSVDFDNPNIKVLKKTTAAVEGADNQVITFTYEWDYGQRKFQETASVPSFAAAGVYNDGGGSVYGTAFYGDGINRAKIQVNPFGSGEVVAFGLKASVNGTMISVEQLSHFAKLGRIAR